MNRQQTSGQSASPKLSPEYRTTAGSLVLVGGGGMPTSVRSEFIKSAGGKTNARIVVIPTASESANDPAEHESFLKPWREAGVTQVDLFHVRQRRDLLGNAAGLSLLRNATGIWLSGGDQSRLTERYLGTVVADIIATRLSAGYVVGGTSAGAACVSRVMITGGRQVAEFARGFDWLPTQRLIVDQHFVARNRQGRLAGLLQKHPGTFGIGIDESTALIINQTQARVLGKSVCVLLQQEIRMNQALPPQLPQR